MQNALAQVHKERYFEIRTKTPCSGVKWRDDRVDTASDTKKRPQRRKASDGTSAEDIVKVLRSRISSQELSPGSRIQEVAMAREFNISRARVREVLGMLEQRGLIERIPNRGAIVTRMEPKEVFEIFDIREVVEGLAVRLATLNAPDGTWDTLLAEFGDPLARRIADGDIEGYLTALEKVRELTVSWADSSHVANILDLVLDKARVIARRVTVLPGRAEAGREMHHKMLQHMARREAAEAEAVKREIIRSARQWLDRYRNFVL